MVVGFGFVIWVWVWLDDQSLVGLDLGFWCGGLEISVDSLDWRSVLMEWWFGDWRRWTGDQPHFDSLSFYYSDSLSQIGFVFWYCFDFFVVTVGVAVVVVGWVHY